MVFQGVFDASARAQLSDMGAWFLGYRRPPAEGGLVQPSKAGWTVCNKTHFLTLKHRGRLSRQGPVTCTFERRLATQYR
jgi:hypothetical protein